MFTVKQEIYSCSSMQKKSVQDGQLLCHELFDRQVQPEKAKSQ